MTVDVHQEPQRPVLIDTYTGEVYQIDQVKHFEGRVQYPQLPLADYPMVIADVSTFAIERCE